MRPSIEQRYGGIDRGPELQRQFDVDALCEILEVHGILRRTLYRPKAIKDFMEQLGDGWVRPDLKGLILDDVWATYREEKAASYSMTDTFVYVQEKGISLRASTKKKDIGSDDDADVGESMDYGRLTTVTDKLADCALEKIQDEFELDDSHREAARAAVLRAFIKEWDTRQYECMIKRSTKGKEVLFMGKTFFGTEKVGEGTFPHIRCHPESGNSWGAAKFLLGELGVW